MIKLIPLEYHTGAENMAIDESLLNRSIINSIREPVFRLYGWQPACVSLGRNQSGDFLDKVYMLQRGIDIVKRLTGGRALLHDKEITYSFVAPVDYFRGAESIIDSYKAISGVLIEIFEKLGIKLTIGCGDVHTRENYCMLVSTGADLTFNGKKLIGSAQYRKNGYILQHGSILYDYDKTLLEKIFAEPLDTNSLTSIKEILPDVSMEEFGILFQDTARDVLLNK